MKKLILALILFSITLGVYSQKKEKVKKEKIVKEKIVKEKVKKPAVEIVSYKHSFGIGAGFTTGVGLSYRFAPKKLGFQINLGPTYSDYGNNVDASVGLTLLNKFHRGKYCNLYFYVASSLYYHKGLDWVGDGWWGSYQKVETQKINSGIGLDFEFNTQKRIVLNVMVGYMQYNNFERLSPTVETALYYRFNCKSKVKS
jgi:hypothetical protein